MSTQKNQNAFSIFEILVVLVVLIVLGLVGFGLLKNQKQASVAENQAEETVKLQVYDHVIWQIRDDHWQSTSPPPDCPDPLQLEFPADIGVATMALWPGQVRGEFKPHGGVRYDNNPSGNVELRAPIDAIIFRVGRYDFAGEPQITFDMINNCGIWVRFDHILELSDNIKQIMDDFPGDGSTSQTYDIVPQVAVKQGDLLATKIGFPSAGNVFFDMGVYDLRQKNQSSKDPDWAARHNVEQGHYAVCWFDLMPPDINKRLRELPTGNEGKVSDYCD